MGKPSPNFAVQLDVFVIYSTAPNAEATYVCSFCLCIRPCSSFSAFANPPPASFSMPGLSSPSDADLLTMLSAHVERHLNPLLLLATNPVSTRPGKPESLHLICSQIVDSPTNLVLVSMAYKCLYLQSYTDILKTLLRHQRYIVQLSGAKKCGAAFQELWTVAMVLQGSRKLTPFTMSLWPLLLSGVPLNSDITPSMVVSHHFLVFQTALQYLSANLQSVVKGASEMTLLVFQDVAQALLSSSNHQMWVENFISDQTTYRKYQQNSSKVLAGFLKVANFLKPKIPANELLEIGICLLELKDLEISLKLGDLQDKSLVDVPQSSLIAPFLNDLRPVASPHFSDLPQIEAYFHSCQDRLACVNPADSITTILEKLKRSNDRFLPHKAEDIVRQSPIRVSLKALTSFPQLLMTSSNPQLVALVLVPILGHLLQNIDQLENTELLMLIGDKIVSHAKNVDVDVFQVLLKGVLMPLSAVYLKKEQTLRLKQISKVCFAFPLIPDALNHASNLDLLTFSQVLLKSESLRIKSRTEFSICKLTSSGEFEKSLDLFIHYKQLFPECCVGSLVVSSLVDCLNHSTDRLLLIFELILAPSRSKTEHVLYGQIFDEVASRGERQTPLLHALIEIYRPRDIQERLQQIYQASVLSLQLLVEIPDLKDCSPAEILYAAGIYVFNLHQSGTLYGDYLALSEKYLKMWLNSVSVGVQNKEEQIFCDILHELFHCSHFQMVDLMVEEYILLTEKRATQAILSLELLHCRTKIEILDTDNISEVLKRSGALMKELNARGNSIQYNQVMDWKLLQFDYFIAMHDISKSNEKFIEIKGFLKGKPGYSYQNTEEQYTVKQKLENFLILARFLISSSKLNMIAGNFMDGLKNIKLALKLLNSILRKLDQRVELREAKKDTEYFLLQSYRMAFQASRHLGLSKDAIHYVSELKELNSCNNYPMFKAFYSFELANYFFLIGKDHEGLVEYNLGAAIADVTHFQILKLGKNISALLSGVLKEESNREILGQEKSYLDNQMKTLEQRFSSLMCLSPRYLNESLIDLQYLFLKKFSGTPQINFENDRRKMLLKTALEVQYKIQNLEERLSVSPEVQLRSKPKVLPGMTHPSFFSEEISRKLSECKEILLKFAETNNLIYLSVNQLFDVSNLLACCVFSLSFVSAMKEEVASTLLESMHFLQDLAKDLPSINQRTLNLNSVTANDLLPTYHTEKVDLKHSDLTFNFRLKQLLPSSWIAVSLDICQFTGNFVITKYDSRGNIPVYYKLPIKEKSGFQSFADIVTSLDLIIKDSNASTKRAVTDLVKTKEDRRNWWKLRFELDQRLKELVDDVEHELLGGFKSIFNSVDSLTQAYKNFRSALIRLWSAFVGSFAGSNFNLSSGLVDLYYSFSSSDDGIEDHHFEDLIIYTYTELTGKSNFSDICSEQTKNLKEEIRMLYTNNTYEDSEHVVLIPSKSCASFPWESMNCLKEKSVSRMPSVGQLLDLLERYPDLKYPKSTTNEIFYLVNPGRDLQKTQAEFGPILESMENATGLCGERPEEIFMVDQLYTSKLFLYLGHGGGEQYVRASTMMKKHANDPSKNLPPALLMGCSSGSFQQNGQLEPSSNIYNWLACGSPLIVSNLWDITDKDIDKFSLAVFRRWGIFPGQDEPTENICNAISKSRSACILRYLNGAAPIIYGLPFNYR